MKNLPSITTKPLICMTISNSFIWRIRSRFKLCITTSSPTMNSIFSKFINKSDFWKEKHALEIVWRCIRYEPHNWWGKNSPADPMYCTRRQMSEKSSQCLRGVWSSLENIYSLILRINFWTSFVMHYARCWRSVCHRRTIWKFGRRQSWKHWAIVALMESN